MYRVQNHALEALDFDQGLISIFQKNKKIVKLKNLYFNKTVAEMQRSL